MLSYDAGDQSMSGVMHQDTRPLGRHSRRVSRVSLAASAASLSSSAKPCRARVFQTALGQEFPLERLLSVRLEVGEDKKDQGLVLSGPL